MKTIKAIPKHTFYEKLAVRTKKENLDYDKLKEIIKNTKHIYQDISLSEFLKENDLVCVKRKIIDLNSDTFLRYLYHKAFENNKKGRMNSYEIIRVAEDFFGVKFDERTNERLIKILRFKHHFIYHLTVESNFKCYGFSDRDDIEILFLFGEIDKRTFSYYKKIMRK
jgi:hypothetical protein